MCFRHVGITQPMYLGGPQSFSRLSMAGSAITFVLAQAIAGILFFQLFHDVVARDFRQYGGGSDASNSEIAPDYRKVWRCKPRDLQRISQDIPRANIQPRNRTAHPRDISVLDAVIINISCVNMHDGIGQRVLLNSWKDRLPF